MLVVVAAIAAVVAAAVVYVAIAGYSAFLLRHLVMAVRLFTFVFMVAVLIGGILIFQWSRAIGARAVMALVCGLWIATTLGAAYGFWWCVDKDLHEPLVQAVVEASLMILVPVVGMTVQMFFYGLWQGLRRLFGAAT